MPLVKRIETKTLLILIFVALFLATRTFGIDNDIVNPDATNWHIRAEQFVVGLKHLQFERTYQHYQPGVTLMWIVGPTVELIKQFNGDIVYTQDTFLLFHQVSRLTLIFVQLGLSLVGISILSKLIGSKKAILVFLLFSLEPFFIANSRILHLDALLTLLLFDGLLFSYLYLKDLTYKWGVLAGIFLGLAVLTKSVALGGVLFAGGTVGLYTFYTRGSKEGIKAFFIILVSSIVTFVLLFPALWVNARNVLELMFDGIERVGIRKGHNQIFFGEATRYVGLWFYPVVFLIKTSPFFIFLLFLSSLKLKKPNLRIPTLTSFLTIFFVGYLVVMTISTKQIDRYFLPMYPYLSLLIVLGLGKFKKLWSKKLAVSLIGILFAVFVVYPFFKLYPYHFTYTNPLFGTPKFIHENILAQKSFGVGIPALRDFLLADVANVKEDAPKVAFLDKKPMAAIYSGSKTFDLEIDGTRRYDLMIIGVNEKIPLGVINSGQNFIHEDSIYINGLEYWRIYAKE